jgi:hypothetical protein
MRDRLKQRLDAVEGRSIDHIAQLSVIDYVGLEDYEESDDWIEVDGGDETVTVYWNRKTGEFRGVYNDRRTDDEKLAAGGKLEYL